MLPTQPPHAVGHATVLQARLSLVGPQGAPPLDGGVVMARLRTCVPPPHSAVHVLHSDQLDKTQF